MVGQVRRQTGKPVSPRSVVLEGLPAGVGQLLIKRRLLATLPSFPAGCCRETRLALVTWFIPAYNAVARDAASDLRSAAPPPPPSLSLSSAASLSWPPARRTSAPSGSRTERAPQTDGQHRWWKVRRCQSDAKILKHISPF